MPHLYPTTSHCSSVRINHKIVLLTCLFFGLQDSITRILPALRVQRFLECFFFLSERDFVVQCNESELLSKTLRGVGDYHQPSIALGNIVILRLRRLIGLRGFGQ